MAAFSKLPAWLQAALTLFAGAALAEAEKWVTSNGLPTLADWKQMVAGALGAGAIALVHRYAPVPANTPVGFAKKILGK